MLRQLRALLHSKSPLPAYVHFHLDDEGHEVLCDESRCRPGRLDAHALPFLLQR